MHLQWKACSFIFHVQTLTWKLCWFMLSAVLSACQDIKCESLRFKQSFLHDTWLLSLIQNNKGLTTLIFQFHFIAHAASWISAGQNRTSHLKTNWIVFTACIHFHCVVVMTIGDSPALKKKKKPHLSQHLQTLSNTLSTCTCPDSNTNPKTKELHYSQ